MGTRNLTAVYIDGEYKVAQYGQWDGYPEGQGLTVLHFLRDEMDEDVFKRAVRNSTYITPKKLKKLWEKYGADKDGFILSIDADRMKMKHPEFSRDTGAEILSLIQSKPDGMKLNDNIGFAADSLFCEWAWVIDFDAGTFEAFEGFNRNGPLEEGERFFFLNPLAEDGYYPVKKVAEWSLDGLPSDEDFLAAFKSEDEEGE